MKALRATCDMVKLATAFSPFPFASALHRLGKPDRDVLARPLSLTQLCVDSAFIYWHAVDRSTFFKHSQAISQAIIFLNLKLTSKCLIATTGYSAHTIQVTGNITQGYVVYLPYQSVLDKAGQAAFRITNQNQLNTEPINLDPANLSVGGNHKALLFKAQRLSSTNRQAVPLLTQDIPSRYYLPLKQD